jgi:predicted nuclease with TOPRIM domain
MEDAMSEPDPNEPADAPQEQLGESGLKALTAERDARKEAERQIKELKDQLKAAKPAADRLKEIEDQQKSDLEKANEKLAELEAKANTFATEALRYRIATKYGISDEDAGIFLTGSDEESIAKQAERLVALQGERIAAQQQKPDPSQGARPGSVKNPKEAGKARARARFGDPGK